MGDGWSTVGKVVVGLVAANVVLGIVGAIGVAAWSAAMQKRMDRQLEIEDEAFNRLVDRGEIIVP
jgi:hypothetical protein